MLRRRGGREEEERVVKEWFCEIWGEGGKGCVCARERESERARAKTTTKTTHSATKKKRKRGREEGRGGGGDLKGLWEALSSIFLVSGGRNFSGGEYHPAQHQRRVTHAHSSKQLAHADTPRQISAAHCVAHAKEANNARQTAMVASCDGAYQCRAGQSPSASRAAQGRCW
eukprot:308706-Rhodomonas_salina.1